MYYGHRSMSPAASNVSQEQSMSHLYLLITWSMWYAVHSIIN